MKINDFIRAVEDSGFHLERTENIERGIRVFLKENFYIDIIEENNEWVLYYLRKFDCRYLDMIRSNIKEKNQEILSRGYIVGIYFSSSSCNVVVIKKIAGEIKGKLWGEYLNLIKIADLVT